MKMQISFLLVIFCRLASSQTASSQETDTLKQGDFLNSSLQLVSANKLFVLGFYRHVANETQNNPTDVYYLAIWHSNFTYNYTFQQQQHPVWIEKRNKYIFGVGYARLALHSFGRLFSQGNATATLLDTGNLVLRETNSNVSVGKLLWQSFDYPTDTLLPGMKLGLNHRTGHNWKLTSWFRGDIEFDTEDGAFSLEWDPKKLQLVVKRRGVISWTSGSLKDGEFEFILPGIDNTVYEFMSETNDEEEYFHYRLVKSSSLASGWLLDYEGEISDPRTEVTIAKLEYCYGYKNQSADLLYVRGCESLEQPKCRNIHQKFELRSGVIREQPYGDESLGSGDPNLNYTISDCREQCWRDCNCAGYQFLWGCRIWSGPNLKFEQDYTGSSRPLYVLISEASASNKKSKKWIPIVIAAAAVVSLATLMFCLLCYLKRKSKQGKDKKLLELMTLDGYTDTIVFEKDGKKGQNLNFFSYSCIVTATNNFSAEHKLGEGGFGSVYKGKLIEGQEIAVKRLSKSSEQGLHEFKTELLLIAKLQHTNLVRIFGCCIHGDEKMLIYEYMPNKSLDFFLFGESSSRDLTWERRFIIIEGITQGLLYLHKYSRLKIVHRDLKASNILLDENMHPKISDFGTARIFKKNLCEINTNKITGTRGYMAPEYLMEGIFSVKSDVFSFGVLMLEIVSGRRNNSFFDIEGPLNLVAYAWELWNRNSAIQLMDPALLDSANIYDQVQRCIHIGLLCVQHSATLRPKIPDVISMLSNDSSALPVPKTPAFYQGPTTIPGNIDRIKSEKFSANEVTISEVGAR